MSHLDTAAGTNECPLAPSRSMHFVGSIGRSMMVIDTSAGLAPGDRTHGPVRAQLLVVCESTGEVAPEQRLNAMAIDLVARELLRDDAWMLALEPGEGGPLTETLGAAVNAAIGGLSAILPAAEAEAVGQQVAQPEFGITAALIAWPLVAVAQSGPGAVIRIDGSRATCPLPPNSEHEGQCRRGSPDGVWTWTAELAERETLILATASVVRSVEEVPAPLAEELAGLPTAKLVVDQLLGAVGPSAEASVAVARLSDGVAGQLQSVTQQEADPPTATPKTTSALDPRGTDSDGLVSGGPIA